MALKTDTLRVGTRGSLLALTQTKIVAAALQAKFPLLRIETIAMKTTGDKMQEATQSHSRPLGVDAPLSQIGGKGLFIKELEEALLQGKIDFAVHSLKDLPTQIPEGLCLSAVLKREDPHDCLVSRGDYTVNTLPKKARVGTSSLRRQAQILSVRADLRVENLRGNLDTRVRKLKENCADALVVALAGIKRLKDEGLFDEDQEIHIVKIPFSQMLPAVAQGCLAIETRCEDASVKRIVKELSHEESWLCGICERSFLKTLEGGCQIPVGAIAEIYEQTLFLEGMISSPSGDQVVREKNSGSVQCAEEIGKELAEKLLSQGGDKILAKFR